LLKAAGAAGVAGLAGCTGGGGSSDSDSGSGGDSGSDGDSGGGGSDDTATATATETSSSDDGYHIGLLTFSMSNAWFQCFARSGKWYAEEQGHDFTITDGKIDSARQTRNAQNLLNSGVDGLIMSAVDSNAAANIVDMANEEGVPVFNASAATNSENVPLYIGFGNYRAGRNSAQALIDLLPTENGEPTGRVAEVMIEQNTFLGRARHQGYQDVISEYDNVENVASIHTKNTQQEAQTKVTNLLQTNEQIDGFHAQAITTGNGTIRALENAGMLASKGEDDHVLLTQIDAGPQPNEFIRQGYIDYCTDQPVQFFNPLAVEYLTSYLDTGMQDGGDWLYDPSVLPSVGDEVSTDDITISGSAPQDQFGVDIWSESVWSPSQIVEHPEFPLRAWFQFPAVEVTPENADAEWLWGNWITDALN
jgi:ribose transport system substrate-binding protein